MRRHTSTTIHWYTMVLTHVTGSVPHWWMVMTLSLSLSLSPSLSPSLSLSFLSLSLSLSLSLNNNKSKDNSPKSALNVSHAVTHTYSKLGWPWQLLVVRLGHFWRWVRINDPLPPKATAHSFAFYRTVSAQVVMGFIQILFRRKLHIQCHVLVRVWTMNVVK